MTSVFRHSLVSFTPIECAGGRRGRPFWHPVSTTLALCRSGHHHHRKAGRLRTGLLGRLDGCGASGCDYARVCVCVFSFERGLKMFLRAKRGAINNIFFTHSCGQASRIERDFATLRRTTNRHQQAAAVLEKEGTSPLGSPYRGSGTLA